MLDLATRVHNHNYKLDPIVRSLMDTDFYKPLMNQQIFFNHKDVDVTFSVKNRSKVPLADIIPIEELKEQLDHARTLVHEPNGLIWYSGNTFYNTTGMFKPEYITHLKTYRLPDYELSITEDRQFDLRFPGKWVDTSPWEIHALDIINTLRYRAAMRHLTKFELDILYSKAKTKLWDKLQKLKKLEGLNLTDFGTRRRHDFLFQEWAVLAAKEALGSSFTGTSNAFLAMKHGLDAKGTNAHELPMVFAALAKNDEELKRSQYEVCKEWGEMYGGALLIALPDTFGTTQFLRDAPKFLESWTGFRFDSKNPIVAGEEVIQWCKDRNIDPTSKLGIFSDGLDVDDIICLHNHFKGKMKVGFGWGTLMTSDFRDCMPNGGNDLDPISLVCKVTEVNGKSAVKLSDNLIKSTGNKDEILRYINVFGTDGMHDANVTV